MAKAPKKTCAEKAGKKCNATVGPKRECWARRERVSPVETAHNTVDVGPARKRVETFKSVRDHTIVGNMGSRQDTMGAAGLPRKQK